MGEALEAASVWNVGVNDRDHKIKPPASVRQLAQGQLRIPLTLVGDGDVVEHGRGMSKRTVELTAMWNYSRLVWRWSEQPGVQRCGCRRYLR